LGEDGSTSVIPKIKKLVRQFWRANFFAVARFHFFVFFLRMGNSICFLSEGDDSIRETKGGYKMETQDNIRYATGEEQYELQAAFGDECDYVVNVITGQKIYFNY
jgi:hypothetical protein